MNPARQTFSVQLLSIEIILKQTDSADSTGLQSSVKILKQIWPLL